MASANAARRTSAGPALAAVRVGSSSSRRFPPASRSAPTTIPAASNGTSPSGPARRRYASHRPGQSSGSAGGSSASAAGAATGPLAGIDDPGRSTPPRWLASAAASGSAYRAWTLGSAISRRCPRSEAVASPTSSAAGRRLTPP